LLASNAFVVVASLEYASSCSISVAWALALTIDVPMLRSGGNLVSADWLPQLLFAVTVGVKALSTKPGAGRSDAVSSPLRKMASTCGPSDDDDELDDDEDDFEDDDVLFDDELVSLLPVAVAAVFLSSLRSNRNAAMATIKTATAPTTIHFALLGRPAGLPGGPTAPGTGGGPPTGGAPIVGGIVGGAMGGCGIACVGGSAGRCVVG
jgi:hypothetical protein